MKDEMDLVLSHLESLSFPECALLKETYSAEDFYKLKIRDLRHILGRKLSGSLLVGDSIKKQVENTGELLEKKRIHLVNYWDLEFPPLLREIPDPPFSLFYRGSLPDPEQTALAVVGTRKPTEAARKRCWTLCGELASQGITIISGLAYGIDGAAHQGSVDKGGSTFAVLAGGLDGVYPGGHRRLAGEILAHGGGLISEYPPGMAPMKHRFPMRNRIISGLSRGTLVFEAPRKSGSLITAACALEQNRDVFVDSESLSSLMGEGCMALAQEGAPVLRGAQQLLWEWNIPFTPQEGAEEETLDLNSRIVEDVK